MNAKIADQAQLAYEWSYWEKNSFFEGIDFCIIGSGIVGLSSAIYIKEKAPTAKVVLLERGRLPIGASTRNAGFACFGSMTELIEDLNERTEDEVWTLVETRYKGLKRLRALLGDKNICYEGSGGYELFAEKDQSLFELCLDHMQAFNKSLKSITGLNNTFINKKEEIQKLGLGKTTNLIFNQAEGCIHTGNMMKALLEKATNQGVIILNQMELKALHQDTHKVRLEMTNNCCLEATKVLVATNGFSKKLLPDLDVLGARNQVLITKPIPGLPLKGCFHYDKGYVYFRYVNDRILLGGARNIDLEKEMTMDFGPNHKIRTNLEELLYEVIIPGKQIEIDYWWTGILGVGPNKDPIIKFVQPNIAVAVRLGGMGVAIGTELGAKAASILLA